MSLLAFDWEPLVDPTLRWFHILSGIIWIGFLYFFNFVNVPLQGALDGDAKKAVNPQLIPRCLWWFRWGAKATFVFGLLLLYWNYMHLELATDAEGGMSDRFMWILWGALLGTVMWFNVWFIIWPAQKKILRAGAAGEPPPEGLPARAKLFSRVNTILSGPMLAAMVFTMHRATMDAGVFIATQVLSLVTMLILIKVSHTVGRTV